MGQYIQLGNVWKTYPMGKNFVHALSGVSLEVQQGEFLALTGKSGSGKSTLMNIIGCLDLVSAGSYILGGVDVACLNDFQLSAIRNEKIGFVFQSFHLLPQLNVLDNIALPMFYRGVEQLTRNERSKTLAESVGLGDRLDHLPEELSGGQKQRVAIARALANDPLLLLADEPTGNLDSQSTEEILCLFEDLHKKGCTIIIVTHETEVAMRAEKIVQLHDGRVASVNVLVKK
jgi:putative ABC transport system ATP-binding protein